ncbi:Tautomerase/MIF [Auricularia subglabra TFB-10046 SS5]|uniref:L-dopachrome isomerase n=1 Tax=Auricularia subglabra (strain TFB-10046 / SS5) TaxID=717982 RepID=J0D0J1_AURST|nr:Tautomerase/MIF [Auricularia subglabra TFB-10046 SS5]
MPALVLTSNVKPADLQSFVKEFSKVSAETLSKPGKYISIDFRHNETLSFAGTFDPAFLLVITSLGNVNPSANEKYSAAFFAFLKEKLGVPGDRGYITFSDPGNAFLGHEGTTFATIFGK